MANVDTSIIMARDSTMPGDMMIKMKKRGNPMDGFISGVLQNDSPYVHGGLAVGSHHMVEVNGGLAGNKSNISRIMANIYLTDLFDENKSVAYVVFRPVNSTLGMTVAREAIGFAEKAEGGAKGSLDYHRWGTVGYNLKAGIKSTPTYRKYFGGSGKSQKEKAGRNVFLDANESVVAMAMREKKSFFCTQFMVWMYLVTSTRDKIPFSFPLAPKEALPGALVAALEKSTYFEYKGCILPA